MVIGAVIGRSKMSPGVGGELGSNTDISIVETCNRSAGCTVSLGTCVEIVSVVFDKNCSEVGVS